MIAATSWGTGQVLWDVLWFFLFIVEVWLMLIIFSDLFRRHDIKGWIKALWVLGVIVFPVIGILLYLVFYGSEMRYHAQQDALSQRRWVNDYLRHAGSGTGPASELATLEDLHHRGVVSDEEYERLKARIVNG